MSMTITNWPKEERPREKLLARGACSLSDAELLAIFLRCGIKGKTAVDLARDLLQHFGSIRKLLDAEKVDFCHYQGLGEAKYAELQAAMELCRRYLAKSLRSDGGMTDTEVAKLYCATQLSQRQQEIFAAIFLDGSHNVVHYAELFYGTVNRAMVYPREVVKRALQYNAIAVVLAHNHISGLIEPSDDDQKVTKQLMQALALIDVKVLDHIIVGNGECFSFAENGWFI